MIVEPTGKRTARIHTLHRSRTRGRFQRHCATRQAFKFVALAIGQSPIALTADEFDEMAASHTCPIGAAA